MTNASPRRIAALVLMTALLVAPLGAQIIYPIFLMKVLCFALFACAFNLLLGFAGVLSFGHAAFFGAGAYVTGYVTKVWGAPTLIGVAAGTAVAAVLGCLFGALAIRRAGIYFAMITLALAQMVYFLALQLPFTGGEDGLQGIPRGSLLGVIDLRGDARLYYFVLAVVGGGLWIVHRSVHSPFGQVLRAIRENEPRAISLGYDVDRYKLQAFVISAALAGLAGSMKALVLQLASLTDVHWHMSGAVVLMTLLGGVGTVFGPIAGALIVVGLENKLGDLGAWLAAATGVAGFAEIGDSVTVITGLIFIACVLTFRSGVAGGLTALYRRVRGSPKG